MTYKNIFLSILVISLTAASNSAADTHMQQLKKQLLQKELELSNLGSLIAEKDKLLSSFASEIQRLFLILIDQRTKQLEESKGQPLSEEEKHTFSKELRDAAVGFVGAFCTDYNNQINIEGMLIKGLIREDNENMEFESLRFFLLRCAFERPILKYLVVEYENCLQEIRVLENEITALIE